MGHDSWRRLFRQSYRCRVAQALIKPGMLARATIAAAIARNLSLRLSFILHFGNNAHLEPVQTICCLNKFPVSELPFSNSHVFFRYWRRLRIQRAIVKSNKRTTTARTVPVIAFRSGGIQAAALRSVTYSTHELTASHGKVIERKRRHSAATTSPSVIMIVIVFLVERNAQRRSTSGRETARVKPTLQQHVLPNHFRRAKKGSVAAPLSKVSPLPQPHDWAG